MRSMEANEITQLMIETVCPPIEKILNYKFKNSMHLLEAMTHRSFKEAFQIQVCYEKLEVLGDAILDYLANANLIKYTMYEKYNIEER